MGIIERLFPKSAAITSDTIRAEIERAESGITEHRAKLNGIMENVAMFSDEEHQRADAEIASIKRAIVRLEARAVHLNAELPNVIAAEEAAAKAAADEALRVRVEACRKANNKEAASLLAGYDKIAEQMTDILVRLGAIDTERESVNEALRKNPIAEGVLSYGDIHRKEPDREASERREMVPHWVYDEPAGRHDELPAGYAPTIIRASLDELGEPIKPGAIHYNRFGRPVQPRLENREAVVSCTQFRPGRRENPLSAIHLPPAFAGGKAHWPRKQS